MQMDIVCKKKLYLHRIILSIIMKKTHITLFLFIFVFLSATSYGKPVNLITAQQVASHFWTAVKGNNATLWMDISSQNGFHEFYLLENKEDAGFIIVSGDDCVQPILGYSTTSLIPSIIPEHIRSFLQRYEQEIQYYKSNNITATVEIEQQWYNLIHGTYTPQNTTAVSPLLTTTWDQAPYYNNLCPDSAGTHALAGCAAIATAQVMKYWNWPVMGSGSHSYTDDNFGYQYANFGATTYQWSQMPNYLDYNSSSVAVNAVATLIYHVGVAVEMDYGINESSAYLNATLSSSPSCMNALKTYFGYKNSLHLVFKNQSTDEVWISTLTSEINAGRPVIEAGSGEGGGHAFVCDGYDNAGLFHINWGWGSYLDGYFAHNNLNPGDGGAGGNESHTYNNGVRILVGIEPEGGSPYQQFTITVNPSNSTMGSVTGSGTYNGSTTVELRATANTGYRFTGWNDGVTTNPRTIVVTDNTTYIANFDNLGDNVRHYDNGTFVSANFASDQTYWGIRFPAGTLSPYTTLSAIRLWDVTAGNYEARIHQGTTPTTSNMVSSQHFQMSGTNNWYETNLSSPVTINHTKPLWVVVYYEGSTSSSITPAAASDYAGNRDGSWLSYDGSNWYVPFDYFDMYVTWMLQAVLTGGNNLIPENTISAENIYSIGNMIIVDGAENTWVEIYDMTGKRIARNENKSSCHQVFNIANSGIYVVRTGNGMTKKVQIIR